MTKLTTRIASAAAIFAAALTSTATPASAEKIANLSAGAWKGGAYTNNATGAFSHCAASARYKSGISLLFAVTRGRQWSMGFTNGGWELRPGRKYPVRFQVDNGPILKATATAKSGKLVQVFLPPQNRLFRHFRTGGQLKVIAGAKRMRFNLTGTNRLLSKLYRCATHFAKRDGNDPFANTGRDPFTTNSRSSSRGDTVSGSSFF